jgi:adenine-specific DNA-methyltransferase
MSARNYYGEGTYSITCPSGREVAGPPPGNYWRVSKDKFAEFDKDKRIWWGKDGNNVPALKRFLSEVRQGVVPQTLWKYEEVGHTQDAKKEIHDIFQFEKTEDVFSTPKPVHLMERILRIATNPGDIALDFFAGSGTFAHAVLNLNQEGHGDRQFILVSSTEATDVEPTKNLCRDVCAERVRRIINGYTNKKRQPIASLGGSFAYLRARRIPAEKVFNRIQHDQVWMAIQLIHARSVSPYAKKDSIQKLVTERGIVIYAPKVSEAVIEEIEAAIRDVGQATIYSWQPSLLEQRIEDARTSFEPIPQYLVNRFGAGVRR